MKRFLPAAVAALSIGGQASAADLYTKAPLPSVYDWSGVYFGGQVGGAWQNSYFQDPSGGTNLTLCCALIGDMTPGAAASNGHNSAFMGGGQVGWNYQIGRLVVGNDFDITGTSLNASNVGTYPGNGTPPIATETFNAHTDWMATATTTIGIAKDRWMFYGKAGVAWAHESYSLGINGVNQGFVNDGVPFSFASTSSDTRIGWTVGTGVAWAFAESWFAKIEYDYLDFGNKPEDFSGTIINNGGGCCAFVGPFTFNTNNTQQISQLKFGLNYKLPPGFLFF